MRWVVGRKELHHYLQLTLNFPFLNEKPHTVDGSREKNEWWTAGQVVVPSSSTAPMTGRSRPGSHLQPLLGAPGDLSLQLPYLGLAERLKQSWIRRSAYQAVGKGVASPSPSTAPQHPCAPFAPCIGIRELQVKGSAGHLGYHILDGVQAMTHLPHTPLGLPPALQM